VARRNVPMLERLAARYRLGIVSNFYGNLATVCDDVGVGPLCGVIVDSVLAGSSKPDPLIFRRAVDGLRVAPAEATFVGDSLARDMAGARAIGMAHIWLAGDAASTCCVGDRDPHAERSGGAVTLRAWLTGGIIAAGDGRRLREDGWSVPSPWCRSPAYRSWKASW
jgi:beta-phosphoglucomutase-like phosphatase (HAD superfamily)